MRARGRRFGRGCGRLAALAPALLAALSLRAAAQPLDAKALSFAKPGARHDDSVRYRLPYDPRIPRIVSQGIGGKLSHQGQEHFAFDFLMPIGTPVLAAREGVVAWVVDGFREGRLDPALMQKANFVVVLHPDGTFATYAHLDAGIPVVVGQRTGAGEEVGRSGDTGYSDGPHLHFDVSRRKPDGEVESLPIRFQLGGQDFVPKAKEYWGAPPPPTVQLRVSVDGKPADPAVRIPVKRGASVRLSVEAVTRAGVVRDVTASPKTRFESLTLWSVAVDGAGGATIRPTAGFERSRVDGDLVKMGTVGVFHGAERDRQRGWALVEFEIAP
jgi:murein DD-endopeptidase MepM/ murein hydrolase activator NlpD